ncbi:MAG: protein kinase [Oscillospiraceae bacterium]|nr:protein kinase [Oscillospiraceae bacterium]
MAGLAIKVSIAEPEPMGFQPYLVGEYLVQKPLTNNRSGFSKWGFCQKDGVEYFLKEFLSPVYPADEVRLDADIRKRKIEQCLLWHRQKKKIYDAIVASQTGNLVVPLSFFKHQSHFYLVTKKVSDAPLDFTTLSRLDREHKILIMKVLSYSFSKLAENNIVHADVKPDNLLIKQTNAGYYTIKVIDFDGSYLASCPPSSDDLQGDLVYYAPETFLAIIEEPAVLTPKVDVFAMGIIFHELLSGVKPGIPADYDYIYEAVLDDQPVRIDDSIDTVFHDMLSKMLCKDPNERLSMHQVFCCLRNLENESKKGMLSLADTKTTANSGLVAQAKEHWKIADDFD